MNGEEKKRVQYIDVARGIAMICIILGHLGDMQINRVVFTFHVPIFFLITGYFFKPEKDWKSFLKKKAKTLLLPYVVTSLLVAIINAVKDAVLYHGENPMYCFLQWIQAALYGAGDATPRLWPVAQSGALWFLLANFWGCLFLRVSLSLKQWWIRIPLILLIFSLGYFTREMWYPLSIQAGGPALVFMYIGVLLSRMKECNKIIPKEAKAAFLVLSIGVGYCFINDFQSFYLVHADIGRGAVDVLSCLCVCYVVLMLSKGLDQYLNKISKPLAWFGKYSILVLCFHLIELNCFPWWKILDKLQHMGLPESWRYTTNIILKFVWVILMTILCANINPLRRVFGLNPKRPAMKG